MFDPIPLPEQTPKTKLPENYQRELLRQFQDLVAAHKATTVAEAAVMKAQADALKKRDEFKVMLAAIRKKLDVHPSWDLTPNAEFFYELTPEQKKDEEQYVLPPEYRRALPVDADKVLAKIQAEPTDSDFMKGIQL